MSKRTMKEMVRYGFVGCVAVGIQYGAYCILLYFLSHNWSYTLSYMISFFVNYLLTTSYTFRTNKTIHNYLGFVACHVINYLLQIILLNVFIYWGVPKQIAPIPVLGTCVPTNFLLVRWVMKKGER